MRSEVAEALERAPISVWRAGWSLVMTVMSLAVVTGSLVAGEIMGAPVDWMKLPLTAAVYAFLWLAGLSYGPGEAGDRSAIVSDGYRGIFLFRAAMFLFGIALVVWTDIGASGLAFATLTAGLWAGALIESVCIGKIASIHKFSLWQALMVSLRLAGLGSREAFRVKGEAFGAER